MDTVEELEELKHSYKNKIAKKLRYEREKLKNFELALKIAEKWKNKTQEEKEEAEKIKEKIKSKIVITEFRIKQSEEAIKEIERGEGQKDRILKIKKLKELRDKKFLELDKLAENFKKGRIKQEEYEREGIKIHLELDDVLEKIDEELNNCRTIKR